MRFPFRVTLFLFFSLLVLGLSIGQALFLHSGLREELLAIQEQELTRELDLAPAYLQGLGTLDPDSASTALARRIGYPVTLMDLDGVVVGASSRLPFQVKGRSVPPGSPEVAAALRGNVGFSRRRGLDEVETRLFAATLATLGEDEFILQVAVPLDGIQRVVRSRVWRSLGLALPGLGVALILTLVLGRSVTRPLHTIGRRAKGLAAGRFARRIPTSMGAKEVRELSADFNRLSDELRSRYLALEGERDEVQTLIDCMSEAVLALDNEGRILRTNRAAILLLGFPDPVPEVPVGALVRQPKLRSLLEESLSTPFSAKEVELGDRQLIVSARSVEGEGVVVTFLDVTEIRRLEMVRRDFVANASHELKTPLTAMRGFAETLLEDEPPPDLQKDFLRSIRSNTLRLQHLVDDLLDLSRLESGGWVAKVETVEIGPLVGDLWDSLGPKAAGKSLDFSVSGNAFVLADEQGLIQILGNLLDNAIQYTPDEGAIGVEITEEAGSAIVVVRDNGAGIPTSALPRIFERFFRVDPARTRAGGGTGLGLAIVRHLVEAMDGRVWAESELGAGTAITVRLPLDPDQVGA